MDTENEQHLAKILSESRRRLADIARPLDAAETLELDEVHFRLLDVENALLDDIARRRRRSLRTHWRELTRPRLGMLRHYAPRPLEVPASYFRVAAPSPAPRISIVTPSFQQGSYLERTLYSVLGQNYPNLEYVVQDGGSTDGSVGLLRDYQASLARWESAPDEGQADAINLGLRDSSGEIMAYLNADDRLLPGSLAFVARYFAAHPDVDVVYGDRIVIDEHDRDIGHWVLPAHDDRMLGLSDFVPQETLFWRRRAWEQVGGRVDASLRFAIDWDLLLRMIEAGARMVHLPRFLGAFRVHDEQKTYVLENVGLRECHTLRRRVHGRAMSSEEAWARLGPYLRRHVVRHTAHRLRARLPQARTRVTTLPAEAIVHRVEAGGGVSSAAAG